MKIRITLSLALSLCLSLSQAQVSLQDIALNFGEHNVGFRHFKSYDSTRTYQRIYDWNNHYLPRPIPISIWYPSSVSSGATMKVLDYMEILKEEEEWEHLPNDFILNWFYYANTPENQEHMLEQTLASLDIPPGKGKFPTVIYAPSYQASSIENFALCEMLASHGYVVISTPSRGTRNKFLEGGSLRDVETQARDVQFLISKAKGYSYVDLNRIATMGFSFGGMSNVLAQVSNKDIKAVISLDGSIKYQYKTITQSPFFEVAKVDVPFIHMAQKDIPKEVMTAEKIDSALNHKFDFFDQLANSEAYQLKFNHLTHSYFSSLGVLFQSRDRRQDKSDREIMQSYQWLSLYSLNFLDMVLKGDQNSRQFIENTPAQNGIDMGAVSVIAKKKPASNPITFQDFNEMAAKIDYEELTDLYKKILKEHPQFEIPEGRLNNLGLQLLFNPETSLSGIKVLLFATERYPSSANLFDSLAEAYLFVGNEELAIQHFKKSLELDGTNQNAVNRLDELSQTTEKK